MAAFLQPRISLQADSDHVGPMKGGGDAEAPHPGTEASCKEGSNGSRTLGPSISSGTPPQASPSSAENDLPSGRRAYEMDGDKKEETEGLGMSSQEMYRALASITDCEMSRRQQWTSGSDGYAGTDKREHTPEGHSGGKDQMLKLSSEKLYELTSSPKSLPLSISTESIGGGYLLDGQARSSPANVTHDQVGKGEWEDLEERGRTRTVVNSPIISFDEISSTPLSPSKSSSYATGSSSASPKVSTQYARRRESASKANGSAKVALPSAGKHLGVTSTPVRLYDGMEPGRLSSINNPEPSPMPPSIPLPPLSFATYLQLELSSQRPSPLYIHRSVTSDFPYESSRIKIDRLLNFLFLPPQLEQVLWFGALACLDAWLFSFTILPLRFVKAISILALSWSRNLSTEAQFIGTFIYAGSGRMWRRRKRRESTNGSAAPNFNKHPNSPKPSDHDPSFKTASVERRKHLKSSTSKHKRSKSRPSGLSQDHKADILKGLLILLSCSILMYFDASRMYHGIRGQAAIKLYVIYNVLEVCDRLFSAIGQDVLECLFSKEALERKPDGRSKVLRPFWLFVLALAYNLVHATALFYQVITLNVAVNSYSNALLTLLMSNQFVEIKSTVFKKFEKENLFQLTCADVVERFQLWLMLMIIASRNIIETGGLVLTSSTDDTFGTSTSAPITPSSILPRSFTIFSPWSGRVMGPFLLVLGSEMLVDWIKHAYITKFNNTKPAIYGRFLDVLAKDYYSNAFADLNLTRRLGLPVIPLACLAIRASLQTYHMFLATHTSGPSSLPSPATALSISQEPSSAPTSSPLSPIDSFLHLSLPTTFPLPSLSPLLITILTFVVLYLALLALKLLLGMALLSFARSRYRGMKERERHSVYAEGRRLGGWGVVEVDDEKKRWIYDGDEEGHKRAREREKEGSTRATADGGGGFAGVARYKMVAKRIW